jgi:hypothetical protein
MSQAKPGNEHWNSTISLNAKPAKHYTDVWFWNFYASWLMMFSMLFLIFLA